MSLNKKITTQMGTAYKEFCPKTKEIDPDRSLVENYSIEERKNAISGIKLKNFLVICI